MGEDGQESIKKRDAMYRLVISQLFYDGFKDAAISIASVVKPHPACPPSDKLLRIVNLGLKQDEEVNAVKEENSNKNFSTIQPGTGIDLEFETEVQTISPEIGLYETCYVTAHKGPCRAAAFHHSGQIVATGSQDTSIKILDVERMLAKSASSSDMIANETPQQQSDNHPVIRTLYDHNAEVMCLDFHPFEALLASGGLDHSIRFFEYSKPSVKKAFKSIQEAAVPMSIAFHPSGDFLLAGTKHSTIRLYDVNTFQCFVASNPNDQHTGPITCVKWCPSANLFVSSSGDGSIKIWDGISNKCINTFPNAHDGKEVCSVAFSRNSKYVLSSGKNSLVKLWELSTSRCLIGYTGAGATGAMDHRTNACFNHTEDYVLFPDEKTLSLCSWDSRNADRQKLLSLGHNNAVRCIVHSPTGPAFISCSDDNRARFWYRKATTD